VVRWIATHQHKATIEDDLQRLRWLNPHLGSLCLDEITPSRCEAIAAAKARESVSPATVNHYLQIIRTILRAAEQE
jgi:hypothetical protein